MVPEQRNKIEAQVFDWIPELSLPVAEPGKSNWEGQTLLNLVWEGQIIIMHCFNSKKVNVYTSIRPKSVTLGGPGPPLVPLSPPLFVGLR